MSDNMSSVCGSAFLCLCQSVYLCMPVIIHKVCMHVSICTLAISCSQFDAGVYRLGGPFPPAQTAAPSMCVWAVLRQPEVKHRSDNNL